MNIVICTKAPKIDYELIKDAQAIDLAKESEKFYERNDGAVILTSQWSGDIMITAKKDGRIVEQTEFCLR
jgi:hypothetical protein